MTEQRIHRVGITVTFDTPEYCGNLFSVAMITQILCVTRKPAVARRLDPLGHRCIWTLDHRLWTDVPAWTERFDTLAQHQTELLAALA